MPRTATPPTKPSTVRSARSVDAERRVRETRDRQSTALHGACYPPGAEIRVPERRISWRCSSGAALSASSVYSSQSSECPPRCGSRRSNRPRSNPRRRRRSSARRARPRAKSSRPSSSAARSTRAPGAILGLRPEAARSHEAGAGHGLPGRPPVQRAGRASTISFTQKAIPPMVGVFVMHGRVRAPNADALDRMNRSFEYDSVSDDYARFLLDELLPHVAKTHGLNLSTDPERSRHRRQQQRRDRGVRRGVAAARRLPARLQRHRHLCRTARRQRVPRADPQDRAETDSHLPPGRPQRPEQLHRQLVRRQPGHAVGAGVRRLRREARMGRRRAQLAARHATLSRGAELVVARLAGADQGQPRREVEAGRLPDARSPARTGSSWATGYRATDGPAVNGRGEMFFTDPPNNRIHKVGLDGR